MVFVKFNSLNNKSQNNIFRTTFTACFVKKEEPIQTLFIHLLSIHGYYFVQQFTLHAIFFLPEYPLDVTNRLSFQPLTNITPFTFLLA